MLNTLIKFLSEKDGTPSSTRLCVFFVAAGVMLGWLGVQVADIVKFAHAAPGSLLELGKFPESAVTLLLVAMGVKGLEQVGKRMAGKDPDVPPSA